MYTCVDLLRATRVTDLLCEAGSTTVTISESGGRFLLVNEIIRYRSFLLNVKRKVKFGNVTAVIRYFREQYFLFFCKNWIENIFTGNEYFY